MTLNRYLTNHFGIALLLLSFSVIALIALNAPYLQKAYQERIVAQAKLYPLEDFPKYKSSLVVTDYFTECAIIAAGAAQFDGSIFERLVLQPTKTGCKNLTKLLDPPTSSNHVEQAVYLTSTNTVTEFENTHFYGRFWHGLQIVPRSLVLISDNGLVMLKIISIGFVILATFAIIYLTGWHSLLFFPLLLGWYTFEVVTYSIFYLLSAYFCFSTKNGLPRAGTFFLFGMIANFYSFLLTPILYLIIPLTVAFLGSRREISIWFYANYITFFGIGFSTFWFAKLMLLYQTYNTTAGLDHFERVNDVGLNSIEAYAINAKSVGEFLDTLLLSLSNVWWTVESNIIFLTLYLFVSLGVGMKTLRPMYLGSVIKITAVLFTVTCGWFIVMSGHTFHGFSHISLAGAYISIGIWCCFLSNRLKALIMYNFGFKKYDNLRMDMDQK